MPEHITPLGKVKARPFPGRIIKVGDPDKPTVKAIQHRLNETGCGPLPETGNYGPKTKAAVELFQTRFTDASGQPLRRDGQVGALTWSALFGTESVPSNSKPATKLTKAAIEFAESQIGVTEKPLGSNRGKQIDEYMRAVGLDPAGGFAWCVAFTHFCYLKAAQSLGMPNPHVKTAGVLDHWAKAANRNGVVRVKKAEALADPGLVKPGSLFIIAIGDKGFGHSGMVVETENGRLVTIEGNTNDGGSRNGIGVFRRNARKINEINRGFVDYSSF